MRAYTDDELELVGNIITGKELSRDNTGSYEFHKRQLMLRRDYLYPLVTELAKNRISLKDVCEDLYDEYMIIISLLEIANNENR